jgi:hypothetical protein
MQYCLDSLFSVRMVAIFCFWGDMAMARTKAQLSADARLADYLTVGYLAMRCPIGKVRETLAQQGLESRRRRGLPHDVLIYFVLAMGGCPEFCVNGVFI